MYNVSLAFLNKIKEPSRTIDAKVDIGLVTIDTTILIDFSIDSSFGSNNMPSLGGVVSNKLILSILDDISLPQVLVGTPIIPYVAIVVDEIGTYEWVKLGEFYAEQDNITITKQKITIECLDIMAQYDTLRYDTTLTYPNTIQNMITEITTGYGINFATQTLPSVSFTVAPTGTVRQVLGMIASLCTTNAIINNDGEVEFRFLSTSGFSFNADNYIDFKLTSDSQVKISQLTLPTDEGETPIIAGDGTGFALQLENDAILDSADLQVVFNREFPLNFYAYDMKAQGMPHLQVGDYVQFTDVESVIRTLAIVNHKFSFNGGMSSEFTVDSPKQPTTDITVTGGSTLSKAIARSYATLSEAIANATGLITGAQGGYLTTIFDPISGLPSELVVADNEDINLAVNVWRWNKGGFGHSSNGYDGTYSLAMTEDGKIVADMITTGTLDASLLTVSGLIVGDNVTMGPNAIIAWDNLSAESQVNLTGPTGATTYTWIKYALNSDGAYMSDLPTGVPYSWLTLWYLVGSEANYDYLTILLDGVQVARVSGAGVWTELALDGLTVGNHTLTFTYATDSSNQTNGNFAAIDNIMLAQGSTITFEDFEDDAFSFPLTGNWARSSTYKYNGSYSLVSNAIGDSESTTETLVFNVPSTLPYMGIAYNKLTPTSSSTASDYAWSLIRGEAGSDANVPSYIESTKITGTTIESCVITGNVINGGTITGATIRTSNTADYFSVKDQYVDFYADNIKNIRIGIDETWGYDKYPFISFGPDTGEVLTMKNYIWYAQGSVSGQVGGRLTMKGSESLTLISNGTTTLNASEEIYINAPSVNINGGNVINLPNGCFLECLTNRLIMHANAGSYLDIRDTGTWLYAKSGTSKQL
jgi:hypothetical protein